MRVALLACSLLVLSACATEPEPAPADAAAEVVTDLEVAPTPGAQAPPFTLVDTNGEEHALEDYAGQTVVLEWLNYDCPFVGKHYGGGNMQALQEQAREDGVVWLSIVSSAPGEQGYFEADAMNERTALEGGLQAAVLLDPAGDVGRAYDARTTPQMIVIDADGKVAYNGAIDDKPTSDQADLEGATDYVTPAIAAAMNGVMSDPATTQPYGCSVKYGA
ncbi:redoxin family protein [Rubrivirga sp.]|uniref:redoxin family protein n=1 Tax=Rubrivirga sp. TaxID=1885344 RepID=UPI003C7203E1